VVDADVAEGVDPDLHRGLHGSVSATMSPPVLIVVDVQRGFDDGEYWGPRDNPSCEANIGRLIERWSAAGDPIVLVRHDSGPDDEGSPLTPGQEGNAFKDVLAGVTPDLVVSKSVNSAFYGRPDLHAWLQRHRAEEVVVCGITTNHCCETTARMAGNLGYDVRFVIDATHTFDRRAPDGEVIPAATLSRITATNLDGEFAHVLSTDAILRP
jgi:nicotinamidase-related amidase